MSDRIIKVSICMGSSCYPRGNRDTAALLRAFVQDNKLEDRVKIKGSLCRGLCKDGPVFLINEEIFKLSSPQAALEILQTRIRGNE